MSIDIVIVGALGRMGIEIANIVFENNTLKLKGCVEYPGHPRIGEDYGICIGKGPVGVSLSDSVDKIDYRNAVIIDFSSPVSTRKLLEMAAVEKMNIVVGTTGLGQSDQSLFSDAAKKSAVLTSPNMSLGVNILFALTELVASRLKNDFDIEIIEAHHRFKKDSPSGTAKRLGEIAAECIGLSYDQAIKNGREGIASGERSRTEIGMHAVRGGDIVGDHTVLFAGIGERIELRHVAHNRSVLAKGAVTAAMWINGKTAGLYSMKDVLAL